MAGFKQSFKVKRFFNIFKNHEKSENVLFPEKLQYSKDLHFIIKTDFCKRPKKSQFKPERVLIGFPSHPTQWFPNGMLNNTSFPL